MLLSSSPTTLAVKTYKVVLPYSQSDKVSAFHAQFYHWDVGICMFIMWGLSELRNRQLSQTKHAKCLQPLSSVWQGNSISCSVLSLRRWYLYVHHVWASAHCNINKPSQTRHAKCLQPLSSVWQGVSISRSVLSLRRWYLYVHHVWASAHCNINKPSQTRHAKCLRSPLVSLTRCQHFMLSSIIETLVLVCSSCLGFCILQHQQTLANKTCQVLAARIVSLTRCQHFMLSSIIETLVLVCSSCLGFCTLQHQQTLANKTCQVLAAPIFSLTRCQHFMLSSIIETLVLVCMFIMSGLLHTAKQATQSKDARWFLPL